MKHSEKFVGLYCVFYSILCVGLLVGPDLVDGTAAKVLIGTCGVAAVCMSAVAATRGLETKRASIAFIAGGDIGTAAVLLCLVPSPTAIAATTIFTGIGNYTASFHGARVLVGHYALVSVVLTVVVGRTVAEGSWALSTVATSTGAAVVVLFTSSVIVQALVSYLRQDAAGAYFDPLTGLRNRRGLLDEMRGLFRGESHDGTVVWSVVVDLDGFKSINDRYGHDRGDDVLRRTASRIEGACPPRAFPARVGGEEFTVIGRGPASAGRECAEKILDAIFDDGDDTPVSASLGVSVADVHHLSTDVERAVSELSSRADAAMYEAKRLGGHRVVDAAPVGVDRRGSI
ncbi:GGDEF domain-containing protein [Actinomycetes bacterium M1A6_2h]